MEVLLNPTTQSIRGLPATSMPNRLPRHLSDKPVRTKPLARRAECMEECA
jgi:hypothetical protein